MVDMSKQKTSKVHKIAAEMARVFNPDNIIADDGSGLVRKYAMQLGIPSICVELGDPSRFQDYFIEGAMIGLKNVARHIHIFDDSVHRNIVRGPILTCVKSGWRYCLHPGLLMIYSSISDTVKEGDLIGEIYDIWGNKIESYFAQYDGVVVAKAIDPVVRPGDRFILLGQIEADQVLVRRQHLGKGKVDFANTREIQQQLQTKEFRIQEIFRTSTARIESLQNENLHLKRRNYVLTISAITFGIGLIGCLSYIRKITKFQQK